MFYGGFGLKTLPTGCVWNFHGFRMFVEDDESIRISFKDLRTFHSIRIPFGRFHDFVKAVNAMNLLLRKMEKDDAE